MQTVPSFLTSRLDEAIGWARKFSIFQYPFVTACCGMEYMATACSHYDVDRFGAGLPRFSPRQADVLFVVGTISHKMAPVLVRIHEQMADPKWVVAFGVCTCTGGFYDNYATVMGTWLFSPSFHLRRKRIIVRLLTWYSAKMKPLGKFFLERAFWRISIETLKTRDFQQKKRSSFLSFSTLYPGNPTRHAT